MYYCLKNKFATRRVSTTDLDLLSHLQLGVLIQYIDKFEVRYSPTLHLTTVLISSRLQRRSNMIRNYKFSKNYKSKNTRDKLAFNEGTIKKFSRKITIIMNERRQEATRKQERNKLCWYFTN